MANAKRGHALLTPVPYREGAAYEGDAAQTLDQCKYEDAAALSGRNFVPQRY
jgi:hypothetical protein